MKRAVALGLLAMPALTGAVALGIPSAFASPSAGPASAACVPDREGSDLIIGINVSVPLLNVVLNVAIGLASDSGHNPCPPVPAPSPALPSATRPPHPPPLHRVPPHPVVIPPPVAPVAPVTPVPVAAPAPPAPKAAPRIRAPQALHVGRPPQRAAVLEQQAAGAAFKPGRPAIPTAVLTPCVAVVVARLGRFVSSR